MRKVFLPFSEEDGLISLSHLEKIRVLAELTIFQGFCIALQSADPRVWKAIDLNRVIEVCELEALWLHKLDYPVLRTTIYLCQDKFLEVVKRGVHSQVVDRSV